MTTRGGHRRYRRLRPRRPLATAIEREVRLPLSRTFFFWPDYDGMILVGWNEHGHPGSVDLTRFLPGNQSPRASSFRNINCSTRHCFTEPQILGSQKLLGNVGGLIVRGNRSRTVLGSSKPLCIWDASERRIRVAQSESFPRRKDGFLGMQAAQNLPSLGRRLLLGQRERDHGRRP
jgi:hypothetical protein